MWWDTEYATISILKNIYCQILVKQISKPLLIILNPINVNVCALTISKAWNYILHSYV